MSSGRPGGRLACPAYACRCFRCWQSSADARGSPRAGRGTAPTDRADRDRERPCRVPAWSSAAAKAGLPHTRARRRDFELRAAIASDRARASPGPRHDPPIRALLLRWRCAHPVSTRVQRRRQFVRARAVDDPLRRNPPDRLRARDPVPAQRAGPHESRDVGIGPDQEALVRGVKPRSLPLDSRSISAKCRPAHRAHPGCAFPEFRGSGAPYKPAELGRHSARRGVPARKCGRPTGTRAEGSGRLPSPISPGSP